jgi:hypothetical protein
LYGKCMVNFWRTVETQQCKVSASKNNETFYIDSSRSVLILGIIAQLLVLLELFKNRDFSRFCMGKGGQEVALCKRWPKLLWGHDLGVVPRHSSTFEATSHQVVDKVYVRVVALGFGCISLLDTGIFTLGSFEEEDR